MVPALLSSQYHCETGKWHYPIFLLCRESQRNQESEEILIGAWHCGMFTSCTAGNVFQTRNQAVLFSKKRGSSLLSHRLLLVGRHGMKIQSVKLLFSCRIPAASIPHDFPENYSFFFSVV